jgi:putative FmdB family regulatory protein
MPLYEYVCDACGHRFEIIQRSFSDAPPDACPSCGKGPVVRQMSSPAIQFKGTGWYITDYAQKGKSGESGSSSTSKSDGGKSDSKDSTSDASKSTDTSAKSETTTTKTETTTTKTETP